MEEHGDKFEEWVILRTQLSANAWSVRLCLFKRRNGSPQAQLYRGWKNFVVDNNLRKGDSLIFVLNVDANCFQVYIFPRT